MDKYELSSKEKRKLKITKLKYLIICITGGKRIPYLRKNNVFGLLGKSVLFQPVKLPNNPKRIKIHDNVKIAADVTFYEHDVINSVFAEIDGQPYGTYGSCIEIHDNVFIGGHSIIVGNVSIGPNAIVAAGSVVVKDVAPGTIVGGNPAAVIGEFDKLYEKRKSEYLNIPGYSDDKLWKKFI